ncbi:MAG: flagellar basal body P-ring formation protein FlgA [Candidatus Competibacter sp.]|nr:flagellar basal body P-ring formation protein FlgA [Candidatus Competibacter sp.]
MAQHRGWMALPLCLGLLGSARAAEDAIQALDAIQQRAHAFLADHHRQRTEAPQIQMRALDPRLRLPKCGTPLEAFFPSGAKAFGNTSVGVRCPGSRPWTVYQSVNVRVYEPVLVASRSLPKGTVLGPADLKAERRDLSALAGGYETAPDNLLGKQLRQPLSAGTAISPQAVKVLPLIRQGETVTLLMRQGGMEVRSSGVALSDAESGQRLRVRNEASKRVVEGTATANREVEVGP